jgi:hypothetical protein
VERGAEGIEVTREENFLLERTFPLEIDVGAGLENT